MVVGFATLVLIGCIPIGVPFGFLWAMKKKSVGLGGINTTALGGAKLNEPEADDDDDDYSFLIKDYRPEYWFYEIVTCALCLSLNSCFWQVEMCLTAKRLQVHAQAVACWSVSGYGTRNHGTNLLCCGSGIVFPMLPFSHLPVRHLQT